MEFSSISRSGADGRISQHYYSHQGFNEANNVGRWAVDALMDLRVLNIMIHCTLFHWY